MSCNGREQRICVRLRVGRGEVGSRTDAREDVSPPLVFRVTESWVVQSEWCACVDPAGGSRHDRVVRTTRRRGRKRSARIGRNGRRGGELSGLQEAPVLLVVTRRVHF